MVVKDKIDNNIDNCSTQCLRTRALKAATNLLASKLSKDVEQPTQISQLNKMSDPRTKTGRLPKYSAVGS
jgi:hypothetical protein